LWAPWDVFAPHREPRPEVAARAKPRKKDKECLRFHQVKVGYRTLFDKKNTPHDVIKDWETVKTGKAWRLRPPLPRKLETNVCGVVWHFIQNPDTGNCGPDPELEATLGGCEPAIVPIQLAKVPGVFDYGRAGELAVYARVAEETGRIAEMNLTHKAQFLTFLTQRERDVDVVGHEVNGKPNPRIQCILHCTPPNQQHQSLLPPSPAKEQQHSSSHPEPSLPTTAQQQSSFPLPPTTQQSSSLWDAPRELIRQLLSL
jgi:hypothetical protein